MHSNHIVYSLPPSSQLMPHAAGTVLLLRDGEWTDKEELQAFVRSGDYFATIATRLDAISDNLSPENEAEAAILQHIVDDLIYLDRTYKLVKK